MKVRIDVADRSEAERISKAITSPTVRAYLNVVGVLMTLPSGAAVKVLGQIYTSDIFTEGAGPAAPAAVAPHPVLPLDDVMSHLPPADGERGTFS